MINHLNKSTIIFILCAQDPNFAGQESNALIKALNTRNIKTKTFILKFNKEAKQNKYKNYFYPNINLIKLKYRYLGYEILLIPRFIKEIINSYLNKKNIKIISIGPASIYSLFLIISKLLSIKNYVIWRDVFPHHNAAENILKREALPFFLAKNLEYFLLKSSYRVSYMTRNCKKYLSLIYKLKDKKLFYIPVWNNNNNNIIKKTDKSSLFRTKRSIVYSGQLSLTRDIEKSIKFLKKINMNIDLFLTNFDRINNAQIIKLKEENSNLNIYPAVEKNKVVENLSKYHIGLVSLDFNLKYPSFPSKIFAYLSAGLPILIIAPKNNESKSILGNPYFVHQISSLENLSKKNNTKYFIDKLISIREDKIGNLKLQKDIKKLTKRFAPYKLISEMVFKT